MGAARNLVFVIAVIVLSVLACWPSAAGLWDFWMRNPYLGGHGPFVAAASLGLILRSQPALAAARLRPSAAGVATLFVCATAWLISWRAGIRELHLALLPLVLLTAVLAAFGTAAARSVAFPLGYLYFAVPVWQVLIEPLRQLTIRVVGAIAPILGMPVTIVGNILYFPRNISFEVTPLCSGVSFLVVGLAVAALIGELQGASHRRRAGLLASMALLMILSNWVRVLVIIVAGYTSDMRSVIATRGHWYLGWLLFALVAVGFGWVTARGSRPVEPATCHTS
jgi:exosortase